MEIAVRPASKDLIGINMANIVKFIVPIYYALMVTKLTNKLVNVNIVSLNFLKKENYSYIIIFFFIII